MESIQALFLLMGIQSVSLEPAINKLSSYSFKEREKAQVALQKQMNVPWAEFLARGWKRPRECLEASTRLRVITHQWEGFTTDYGLYPWIDALPKDFPGREQIVQKYLREAGWWCGPDYGNYRYATYLWLMDLRSQGYWDSSLRRIQEPMVQNEQFWKTHHRFP